MLTFLRIVIFSFTLASILGLSSRFLWLGDLCSHFFLQYGFVLIICFVALLVLRDQTAWFDWCLGGVALFICGMQVFSHSSWMQAPQTPADLKTLKIVLANVNSQNRDFAKLMAFVNEKNPDLFGLIEINDAWIAGLAPLAKQYHHVGAFPHEGNFGLGLFSRLPLSKSALVHYGATGIPSVEVHLDFAGRDVLLLLTHPYPPVRPKLHGLRNGQLAQIILALENNPAPKIVMGDFNATPFCWALKNFLKRMHLKDSRQGFGFQATWPSVLGAIGIPIDHVLLSSEWVVLKREVGPDIGSDHRPVYVEIALPDHL